MNTTELETVARAMGGDTQEDEAQRFVNFAAKEGVQIDVFGDDVFATRDGEEIPEWEWLNLIGDFTLLEC